MATSCCPPRGISGAEVGTAHWLACTWCLGPPDGPIQRSNPESRVRPGASNTGAMCYCGDLTPLDRKSALKPDIGKGDKRASLTR
jgi:hypothetical protein